MSRLDDLIREYCPDGVDFLKIQEVCSLITDGSHFSPNGVDQGFFMPSVKDMRANGFDFTNCKKISDNDYRELVKNGCKPLKGDLLVAKDGSMLKYAFTVKQDMEIVLLSSIAIFRPIPSIIDGDFLGYYITSERVRNEVIRNYSSKGGVPRIILGNFKKILIPVPPIEVQREIVRILDIYTAKAEELKEKLTAELTARKKQYEYYRGTLLSFSDDVAKKRIGDVCDVLTGGEPPADCIKGDTPDAKHPYAIWGNGKDVYGYASTYRVNTVAVVVSSIGANTGAVYFRSAFFTPIIRLKVVIPKNDGIDMRYLFHVLSATRIESKSSSVPNMNAGEIKSIKISVPDINVQRRIADILDRFDCICTDYSKGLPAEIEARQKQYEYYRDKLLTFKEKTA